ncbi:unnamed protein product [Mytilus coruscus]|uniref:Uncharacterized protein n=1 Tax=Mytilus coruscus TaxID=42192 RepID=A0A6J8BH65_MYTCO|nr:unnamed protein product [Mytilus coruscus]
MMYVMIVSSITTVIIIYMNIIHTCVCVKHKKTRGQRPDNEHEVNTYHTYDEIGTISYRAVRTVRSSNTSDNQGQNPTHQHAAHSSNKDNVNVQSTDDNTPELNADFINDGLPQVEVNNVQRQRQHMFIPSDDTNFSNTDLSQIPSTIISNMDNIVNCNTTNEMQMQKHQVIKRVKLVMTLIVTHQIMLW